MRRILRGHPAYDWLRAAASAQTPESLEGAFDRVVQMYDGYRFEESAPCVVNPVSFGRCLCERKFKDYWYATGTPTFLVNMLKERPVDISEVEVSESDLGTYEPTNPSLVPLLYQTGYLTIKKFDPVGESAQLKPRNGVRHRLAEKRRLTIGDGQENASCAGRLTTTLLPRG